MSEEENNMHIPDSIKGRHHTHLGPVLGILLLILVIALGALYLWGSFLHKEEQFKEREIVNNEPETPRAVADAQILETVSPSDDLSAIEADLSSTQFDSIDNDMTAIEAELDAVLPE